MASDSYVSLVQGDLSRSRMLEADASAAAARAKGEAWNANAVVDVLKKRNQELEEDNKYYRDLLCKPMAEIAAKNGDFKKTYELQQATLADWIHSQKAFLHLNRKHSEALGINQDGRKQELVEAKVAVESEIKESLPHIHKILAARGKFKS